MAKTARTLQQIKAQWGLIKMAAKKRKFQERKERLRTGGGPPPASEPASGADIAVWLPHEFTIDSNEFDSDSKNFQEIRKNNEEHVIVPQQILNIEEQVSPVPFENSEHDIIEMMLEPSTSTQPEDTTTTATTPKHIKVQNYRLKNKKVNRTSKDSAAFQIAETETACRKELHEAQMANEKQKLKNLVLKEQVLKAKLEYSKNKLN